MQRTIESERTDPQPGDPPFLFCILLAARKSKDRVLESLARDWLADLGIHVVLAGDLDGGKAVGR